MTCLIAHSGRESEYKAMFDAFLDAFFDALFEVLVAVWVTSSRFASAWKRKNSRSRSLAYSTAGYPSEKGYPPNES